MKRVSLDVSGLNETLSRLKDVAEAGLDSTRAVVEEVTREVHSLATGNIVEGGTSLPGQYPKSQTGRLRSSIRMELPGDAGRAVGMVGSDALHARFLEHGTASMEPRPWLLPSFETAVEGVAGDLKAEFESRI